MKNKINKLIFWGTCSLLTLLFIAPVNSSAQSFNYGKLYEESRKVTLVIDMTIEFSFGIHKNEQKSRFLGTVVSGDGLVIFNGTILNSESSLTQMSGSGYNIKIAPTDIKVTTHDGIKMEAEYVGVDRFTNIAFLKVTAADNHKFVPVKFKKNASLKTGQWLTLYSLLPDFISPSMAADIAMVSVNVTSPEEMPLVSGFNLTQLTSVVYNEFLEPVGVLGRLNNPSAVTVDPNGMLDSFNPYGIPLLGVISGEKLQNLVDDPPQKGETDRAWLGITLQALTTEMATFWELETDGGIIINDIVKNSPAEKAGLVIGDIIYEVNGEQVDVDKDEKISIFQRSIAEMGPGVAVELSVIRRSDKEIEKLKFVADLEKAPMSPLDAPEYENKYFEFKVREMVFVDYNRNNLDADSFQGVVVSELKQGGLAEIEGLGIQDIIQKINGREVTSIEDVEEIMTEIEANKTAEIIFFIWRDQKTLFVNLKTDWE